MGNGLVNAQEWTWEDPAEITAPVVVKIAADPSGDTVYALDDLGDVLTLDPVTGTLTQFGAEGDGANDLAVEPMGQLYICTVNSIKFYDSGVLDFQPLPDQPTLPPNPCDVGTPVGAFTSITVGEDGKLYVIYEVICQLGLVPEISDPKSLLSKLTQIHRSSR